MSSIILSLAFPLRKIMIKELFLIKFYGGSVVFSTLTTILFIFISALIASLLIGVFIMYYINLYILTPYNVPLMQFDLELFQWGALCVFLIWFAIWSWLCLDLKDVIDKYGLSKGD